MGKKIRITEDELMKIISDVIREYVEERSLIRGDIIIRTYSLKDSKDYEYISSKLDEIYNIIQHGYANAGGSIGLRKKKDLLKKTYMRLAFYRDNIVAVATYNNIYGGNKMDYCAAIRGDLHDIGKVALESIIKRDKMNISEFNWVEASGKVAELFNQYGAYRLPSKYVYQALGGRKEIKIINEFEYEREIGNSGFFTQKMIFGFSGETLLRRVYRDLFGEIEADIETMYKQLLNLSNNLSEYLNRNQEKALDIACIIADRFYEFYDEWGIYEFPPKMYNAMQGTMSILNRYFKGTEDGDMAIRQLEYVLSLSTVFEIRKVRIKFDEKDLI